MQTFLKKALITVIVLLALVGLFWSTLTTSTFWIMSLYQTWDDQSVRTTPDEVLTLTFASSTASSTTFNTIVIPHTFAESAVFVQDTGGFVIKEQTSNSYYLTIKMAPFVSSFTRRSGAEGDNLCTEFSQITDTNPCLDDATFLSTVMSVSTKTAGLFADNITKEYAATFMLLKAAYLPSDTNQIQSITSDLLTGYLVSAPERSIAYVFDANQVGYEIAFIKMSDEQIVETLSSITPAKVGAAQVE